MSYFHMNMKVLLVACVLMSMKILKNFLLEKIKISSMQ